MPTASGIVIACAGFLLAVLWMDLMFDVQVLRHRRSPGALPEEVLASIAAYYRRVTTEARPMSHLIAAVMVVALVAVSVQVVRGPEPRWVGLASLALAGGPFFLVGARVLPNAVRLGTRADAPPQQSALARSICRDHLLCLVAVVAILVLQLWAAAR